MANATTPTATTETLANRTKIPLTRRSDGWYALPATVNGTAKQLLLTFQSAHVVLTCKDANDPRWVSPTECHNRTGDGLDRFDDYTCVLLSYDKATLTLGANASLQVSPAMAAFNETDFWDVPFPPSDVDGVLGLGVVNDLKAAEALAPGDLVVRQWRNFSLFLGDSDPFVLVNGVDSELITREGLTPVQVNATPLVNGWTPACGGLLVHGEPYPQAPSPFDCMWQNDSVLEPSYPYIAVGQRMLDKIVTDWQHWPCKPTAPRKLGGYIGQYYVCDASFTFPPLGFALGDTTFFVPGDKYTRDMTPDGYPELVELLLVAKHEFGEPQTGVWLGRPFLSQFYTVLDANASFLTVYCKDGVSCTPTRDALERNDATKNLESKGLSGLGMFVVIAAAIMVVVGAASFFFVRQRKRRAKAAASSQEQLSASLPTQ